MKAIITATLVLASLATSSCTSDASPAPQGFCAAIQRLHVAGQALAAQNNGASPEEVGSATAQFVTAHRADIDTAMNHAPPEIQDDTQLIYGTLVSGQAVSPEDVPAVQASGQDIQKYVEDHCAN